MVSFTNYFVVLQGSEWCQKAQFSEMMYYDNVCSEKKNTKRSSNTLLCLVLFFSERTLHCSGDACVLISMRTVFPSEIHTTLLLET